MTREKWRKNAGVKAAMTEKRRNSGEKAAACALAWQQRQSESITLMAAKIAAVKKRQRKRNQRQLIELMAYQYNIANTI
jgi:predicted transposase YbfD/YdcC